MTLASAFASNPLWYLTRATGVVAFLLLTGSVLLGVASTQRTLAAPGWPRFATQQLHRNVAALALVFVLVHIVTTLMDSYVHVGVAAVVVPFVSGYRATDVAWGTIAFDLLLVVAATGWLRLRMSQRTWRTIHLSAYLAWPLALLHFIGTGTDGSSPKWGFWLGLVCAGLVATAGALRWRTRDAAPTGPVRSLGRAA
ncbi:MAG: ferric reductase-like transmembrane domain-containing protein [Jatrophihabitans sp.]|uniref:ferric reductase-like transmembrane domain-containing protein n=1 Tax=Jatrophihabitans sp. TaxID=1932789 RepID=UPI003F80371D